MLKGVNKLCVSRFPVVSFGFVSVAIFNLSQNGFHLCSLDKVSKRYIFSMKGRCKWGLQGGQEGEKNPNV